MRSNLEHWKQLQDENYFENHPCYNGLVEFHDKTFDCLMIEKFMKLDRTMNVVVIGCGYGRESANIAKRVHHVYGIDVNETILAKAKKFVECRGVTNFTPVLAESFTRRIPNGIEVVYSMVVMQHLTRDLVRNYVRELGLKLSNSGGMVIQFADVPETDPDNDAEDRPYEPSVNWSRDKLHKLAIETGVKLKDIHTVVATPKCDWHWAFFQRT